MQIRAVLTKLFSSIQAQLLHVPVRQKKMNYSQKINCEYQKLKNDFKKILRENSCQYTFVLINLKKRKLV